MVWYMVTAPVYACLGAVRILGVSVSLASFPDALKPSLAAVGVCQTTLRSELYDPARLPEAWARLAALGRGATLSRCRPMSCEPVPVVWRTEPVPTQGDRR